MKDKKYLKSSIYSAINSRVELSAQESEIVKDAISYSTLRSVRNPNDELWMETLARDSSINPDHFRFLRIGFVKWPSLYEEQEVESFDNEIDDLCSLYDTGFYQISREILSVVWLDERAKVCVEECRISIADNFLFSILCLTFPA